MMMIMLSLFWHTGKDRCLHLAKAGFAKKISEVSAANRLLSSTGHSAPPRSLARSLSLSLYCIVPNLPHTCTPHNKALCPSHTARHSILFILRFDRCCNLFPASCKDIATGTEEEEVISRSTSESDTEESHIAVSHLRHVLSPSPASLGRRREEWTLVDCSYVIFPLCTEREREREREREILNA